MAWIHDKADYQADRLGTVSSSVRLVCELDAMTLHLDR
jgi:hypothetical protein